MEEQLSIDPQFKDGFNKGYIIAQNKPDLFDVMPKLTDNPFNNGLLAGKLQFDAEKAKDFFKSFGRGGNDKDRSKDIKR